MVEQWTVRAAFRQGTGEACTRAMIPHLRPAEYKRSRLPRNQRTVNRPYGGVLSGVVVREREETVVIPVSLGAALGALTELNVHWPESLLTWLLSVDTWSKIQVKILTPADMASINSTRSCKYSAYYKAHFREHQVRKNYKTIIWSGEGDSALET